MAYTSPSHALCVKHCPSQQLPSLPNPGSISLYHIRSHLTGRSTWAPYFNSTFTHSVLPASLAYLRADRPRCTRTLIADVIHTYWTYTIICDPPRQINHIALDINPRYRPIWLPKVIITSLFGIDRWRNHFSTKNLLHSFYTYWVMARRSRPCS